MNKNGKIRLRNTAPKAGQKRFLINAAVLAGACVLLLLRIPSWDMPQAVPQVIVLLILAAVCAFQVVLYFKLR